MKLKSVTIKDFKAIESVSFDVTDTTMLVGANNSGKSSVLQAIHLAARTIAQAKEANKQSTLSLADAEYVPSEDYKDLGHFSQWGNLQGSPGSTISFVFFDPADGTHFTAAVTLKSARNEGIQVSPSLDAKAMPILRAKDSMFTAYIPGIAGIPLRETVISTRHVFRKAASGDSNVVLRNILLKIQAAGKLPVLLEYIRGVYPGVVLDVSFSENEDFFINVSVTFGGSKSATKPLEFCGAGFIHVLQIFSYLVLFKPRILLIDEPESHLHPTLQTTLVRQLQQRVRENGSVALLTTHSPFVARGLPMDSRSVWVDQGAVVASGLDSTIRMALGWGALDKRVLICTEDSKLDLLNSLLDQVDTLLDKAAAFPFSGVSTLGSGASLRQLAQALGSQHRIVVHRDRDCMIDAEVKRWQEEYRNHGHTPWVTDGSDLEMYFCEAPYIAAALSIDIDAAQALIDEAITANAEAFRSAFSDKRAQINKKVYEKVGGSPSTDDLWNELPYTNRIRGKDLLSKIRTAAKSKGYDEKLLGRPAKGFVCAPSLLTLLESLT